ncbi:MAG: flagellar biosynthesis repressor FlbT [Gallionellaceae bacterium]|nr:flagellar biosynthesis repressor FlbT [Gallionellaceae bacterium]
MPLKLDLRPHEKLFLGGAVLVNGDNRCQLTVLNDVPVLREKDILKETDADTPCKRIYLAVQMMYMDAPSLARYHQYYWEQVKAVIQVAPSTTELIGKVSDLVLDGLYYQALKAARELINYEQELLSNARKPA